MSNFLVDQLKRINVPEVESKIGYTFRDKSILRQAFCRSSYGYECSHHFDNEELEFIGDSALGMIISRLLAKRLVKREDGARSGIREAWIEGQEWTGFSMNEAEMSEIKIALVRREALASAMDELGLARYLCLGAGDEANNVRSEPSVKEDLFEAIIGAVAFDCDWNAESLEAAVVKMLDPIKKIETGFGDTRNYAGELCAWYLNEYQKELEISAFDNGDSFFCEVSLGENMRSKRIEAEAQTEQGAIRLAAKRACEFIESVKTLRERIIKAVGEPNINDATMQLNNLINKKIIPHVESFIEAVDEMKRPDGNSYWIGIMEIAELDIVTTGMIYVTKKEAKARASFELLQQLIGNEYYTANVEGEEIKIPTSKRAFIREIRKFPKEEFDKIVSFDDGGLSPDCFN